MILKAVHDACHLFEQNPVASLYFLIPPYDRYKQLEKHYRQSLNGLFVLWEIRLSS